MEAAKKDANNKKTNECRAKKEPIPIKAPVKKSASKCGARKFLGLGRNVPRRPMNEAAITGLNLN